MKKSKLHTFHKGMPAFLVDRETHNIFDGFSNSTISAPTWSNFQLPKVDWSDPMQRRIGTSIVGGVQNLWSQKSKESVNNFGKGPLVQNNSIFKDGSGPNLTNKDPKTFFSDPKSSSSGGKGLFSKEAWQKGGTGWATVGAVTSALGSVNTGDPRGMWDTLDPVYHIAGGRESGVGNAMSDAGVSLTQAGISSGQPWLALAGAGLKVVGGLANAAFGVEENKANIDFINKNTTAARDAGRALGAATTNDSVLSAAGNMTASSGFDWSDLYKNGWFTSKGTRMGNELIGKENAALAYQNHGLYTGAENADKNNDSLVMASFKGAYGGPIETMHNKYDMGGAIDYSLKMDALNNYRTAIENKNKMPGLIQAPAFMPQGGLFAFGGDAQVHGADFPTGLMHIDAGGSHEENPYDGVQIGVDPEGTPNLVEEGETIYDDYVFSGRIYADGGTLQKLHLPKKSKLTFAAISKKLEKQIKERENDPIAQNGFKANMETLREEQERQKQEMDAQRAQEAFAALSPEEQTAILQQAAAQEQAVQEAAMQQEAMAQQGITPEDVAMAQQQQMMQADGTEAMVGAEPQMACYGGKLFAKGGIIKFLNTLGYKTVKEAEEAGWKPSDFGNYKNWSDINSNSQLSDDFQWQDAFAERIKSSAMKAALSLGFDPTAPMLGRRWYEGDNGNNIGWSESYGKDKLNAKEFKEYANRYKNTLGWAVDKGIIKAPEGNGTISMAEVAKAMSQAPDWQNTDKWLYSDIANQAAYLGMARGLNPDDDTKFTAKWSPYGTFSKGEDGKWNYALKSNLTDAQKKAFTDQFRKSRTDNKVGVMYNNFTDPTSVTNRYVLDERGNPVLLTTSDLSGYTQLGSYSWGNDVDNVNNSAVIYQSKEAAAKKPEAKKTDEEKLEEFKQKVAPKYQHTMFSVGDLGPIAALAMQGAGVGKPDKESLYKPVGLLNPHFASPAHIGGYYTYKPDDPFFDEILATAENNAVVRAGTNNAAPLGNKQAFILAADKNYQDNIGRRRRESQRYNNNERLTALTQQKDTDKWNADADNRFSMFNAGVFNDYDRTRAQMGYQAARDAMAADNDWFGSIYANTGNLFKGLEAHRQDNARHNMIADMAANGLFGIMTPDSPVGQRYLQWVSAEGGKIKKSKKRGLTY